MQAFDTKIAFVGPVLMGVPMAKDFSLYRALCK